MMSKLKEILFFLRFVLLALAVGFIVGGLLFLYLDKNKMGIFLFEIFTILGLAFGISWALWISKNKNISDFISFSDSQQDDSNDEEEQP